MNLARSSVLTFSVASVSVLSGQVAPPILNAPQAGQHVGEVATVCGRVVSDSCGAPDSDTTFLRVGSIGPSFRIRIPEDDRPKFPLRLADRFLMRNVASPARLSAFHRRQPNRAVTK
jgi:hypothetical protein